MNMKRIIPSFLLAALTSSSLLVAQNENRLKATDYRLEETEKKGGGSRLQEVKGDCSDIALSTITACQYCDFLNAVAATNDSHDFYNSEGECNLIPIICSQISGGYHYSVIPGKEDDSITGISLLDGMRYCNWLENGQPKGTQAAEAAEDGVYTLKGNNVIAINPNATKYLVNPEGSQINGVVIISSLSNLPSSTDLLQRSPDCGLYIESTTAPQLMMEPSLVKNVEKSIQDLGVTTQEGRAVSAVGGSSSSTVVQAVGIGHAASSSSSSFSTMTVLTEEQKEIKNLLSKKIEEHKTKLADYYKKADEQWNKYHDAWENDQKAVQKRKQTKIVFDQADKDFKDAEEKCKDIHPNKTNLGKVSDGAKKVADALNTLAIIVPQVQVLSMGVTVIQNITDKANQEFIYGDKNRAQERLNKAKDDYNKARDQSEVTRRFLEEKEDLAKKYEQEARKFHHEGTLELAKKIQAPLSNDEAKWEEWAKQLIDSDSKGAGKKGFGWFSSFDSKKSLKEKQANYKNAAQKQAKWVHNTVKTLWREKFQNSRLDIDEVEKIMKSSKVEAEKAFKEEKDIREKFKTSKENLNTTVDAYIKLTEEYQQYFKDLEEDQDENILDEEKGYETSRDRLNNALREFEKEKIPKAIKDIEVAKKEWEENVRQKENQEKNSLKLFKEFNVHQKAYASQVKRAEIDCDINREAMVQLEEKVAKALECFRAEEENLGNKNALQIIEELKQQYAEEIKEARQIVNKNEKELAGVMMPIVLEARRQPRLQKIEEAQNRIKEAEGKLAELDLVKERIIKIEKLKLKAKEALQDAYKNHKLALDVADCESLDKIKKTSKAMESSNKANQESSLVQQFLNEFDVWHKAINKINKAQRTHKDSVGKQTEVIDETASSFVAELKPWIENEFENMRREIESMNDMAMCQNDIIQSRILFQIQEISKKARELENLAQVAQEQTEISDSSLAEAEIEVLWNDVIEKNKQAQKAWAEVIEKEKADFHAIPEAFKGVWSNAIEEAKNKQATLNNQVLLCEVKKAENLAEAAKEQADVSNSTTEVDVEALWDKAIEKSKQAEEAWDNFASDQQEISVKEDAENSRSLWQTQASWYKAQKAESLAKLVQRKVSNSKDLEFKELATHWNNVPQKLKEFSEAWTEAKENQKVGYAKASERLKDSWSNLIKDIDAKANVSSIWILPTYSTSTFYSRPWGFPAINSTRKLPATNSARKDVGFALEEEWRYLTAKTKEECDKITPESLATKSVSRGQTLIRRANGVTVETAKNKIIGDVEKRISEQFKTHEIASHKIEAALFENIFERCFSVRPVFVPPIPGQQPIINENVDQIKCFLGNSVGENAYIKAFDTVWPGIIQVEQERSQRIFKIKNEIFRNANDAWSIFINSKQLLQNIEDTSEEYLIKKNEVDAKYKLAINEEVKAKIDYADAIKNEAVQAASNNEHTRAAEGAWAGRVNKSAEMIDQSISKLRQTINDLKIEANLKQRVNNAPEFLLKARTTIPKKIFENEYQLAVRDLERAIATTEADVAAWQAAWPEDFQKEESIQAKEYKNFVINKIENNRTIDKLEKDFVRVQQECGRLRNEYMGLRNHRDYKNNLIIRNDEILPQYKTIMDQLNKYSDICDHLNKAQTSLLDIEDFNKESVAINKNIIDHKIVELYQAVTKAQDLFDQIFNKYQSFVAVEQEPGRTSNLGREKEANVKGEKIIIEMNYLLGKPSRNATPDPNKIRWENLVDDAYSLLHLACENVITNYYGFIEAKYNLQSGKTEGSSMGLVPVQQSNFAPSFVPGAPAQQSNQAPFIPSFTPGGAAKQPVLAPSFTPGVSAQQPVVNKFVPPVSSASSFVPGAPVQSSIPAPSVPIPSFGVGSSAQRPNFVPPFVSPVSVQQPIVNKFVPPVTSFVPGVPVQQPGVNKFVPPVPSASSFVPGAPVQQPHPMPSVPSFTSGVAVPQPNFVPAFVPPIPVQQAGANKFVLGSSFTPGVAVPQPNFVPSFVPPIPVQQPIQAPSVPSFIPGGTAKQPVLAPSFFPGAGNSAQTPNQGKK